MFWPIAGRQGSTDGGSAIEVAVTCAEVRGIPVESRSAAAIGGRSGAAQGAGRRQPDRVLIHHRGRVSRFSGAGAGKHRGVKDRQEPTPAKWQPVAGPESFIQPSRCIQTKAAGFGGSCTTAKPEIFQPLSYAPERTFGERAKRLMPRCRMSAAHHTESKGIPVHDNLRTLMDAFDGSSRVQAYAPRLSNPETAETTTAYPHVRARRRRVSREGCMTPPKGYRRPSHLLKYHELHLCPLEDEGSPALLRPFRAISGIRLPAYHKSGAPAVITQSCTPASRRNGRVALPSRSAQKLLLPGTRIPLLKLTRSGRPRNSSLLVRGPAGRPTHPRCPQAPPHLHVRSSRGGLM